MINRILLAMVVVTASIFAAQNTGAVRAPGKQKGEGKVDSMVYDQPTEWRVYSVDGAVHAFCLQGEMLWIANDASVASVNTRGKRNDVQKFKKLGSMAADGIVAIAAERHSGIWFGGPNGLACKNGSQVTVYTAENGLPDTKVTAVAAAQDGSVWVGTENGACVFQSGAWKKFGAADGLVSDKIQCLIVDGKGAVWVGTDKGISVFSGGSWSSQTMKNGMSWNNTKALGCDARKGVVWAAVGDKDVNCFDGQKWSVFMEIQPGITSIMVDSHGRVWFGSLTGLVKFNGDDWINDPKQLGVPGTQVFQMYCDGGGNLWYANETGVVRMANPYPY